jgi:protein-disulfide isomerase
MKKIQIVAITTVILVLLYIGGSYFYAKQQRNQLNFIAQEDFSTFVREYAPTYGDTTAKVYLVEFFDPACETCRDFYWLVKEILSTYPSKVQLVLRYAPFHKGSDKVVAMLEAARIQGKYWEVLETLYKYQAYWTVHHQVIPEKAWKVVASVGIDVDKAKEDARSPEIARRMQQDIVDIKTLGVRKTPGFFVNGQKLETFGYQNLKSLVESEVTAQYGK